MTRRPFTMAECIERGLIIVMPPDPPAPNPDQYASDRHRPGAVLREAIRTARAELRGEPGTRRHSLVGYRMALGNLARWRRGLPMRSWTYAEVATAGPGTYRMHETLVKLGRLP